MTNAETLKECTRRHFFQSAGFGIGSLALAQLLSGMLSVRSGRLAARALLT